MESQMTCKIKIEIGQLFKNRTLKYLVPALNFYGPVLKTKLNLVHKLAFGIFDNAVEGSYLEEQKNIYILVDKFVRPDLYENFSTWIQYQPYYVTDYPVDDIGGRQHMFLLAFPQPMEDAYDKFLLGKYSKMYQKQELVDYFKGKEEALAVFNRTAEAKLSFIELVKERFEVTISPQSFKTEVFEYDLPPDKYEEIFN